MKKIFPSLDKKIFNKIDDFKSSKFYEQYRSAIDKFPDTQQKLY